MKRGLRALSSVTFLVSVLAVVCPGQVTWHVDDDALAGGNGTSWNTAFQYLQDGLAAAMTDDVVRIAGGTYRPDQGAGQTAGDRSATFRLREERTLEGGYRGLAGGGSPDDRDPDLFVTVLSGDLNGDDVPGFGNHTENSYQVTKATNMPAPVVLDGLTIRGGNADGPTGKLRRGATIYGDNGLVTMNDCRVTDSISVDSGPGLYMRDGQVTVTDCLFEDTSTNIAGAGVYGETSTMTVSGCVFQSLYANRYGAGVAVAASSVAQVTDNTFTANDGGSGGGIWVDRSTATVSDCDFVAGIAGLGGGIDANLATLTVSGCSFTGNRARTAGGALYCSGTTLILTDSRFTDNFCSNGEGGALRASGPSATVMDCTFTDNHTNLNGDAGAIFYGSSSVLTRRCVFTGNQALHGGAIKYGSITSGDIEDCRFTLNYALRDAGAVFMGPGNVVDCDFRGNQSIDYAGALMLPYFGAFSDVRGCTFWSNTVVAGYGGGLYHASSVVTLDGNIFWGNLDMDGGGLDAQVAGTGVYTYAFNCVEGWVTPSNGNHGLDPAFVDRLGPDLIAGSDDDDLTLLPSSPCVEGGDPLAGPGGTDAAGRPRLLDGDLDRVRVVDQGAHEFSNVTLTASGNFTPGGVATLDSTGTAGLRVFLFVGLGPGEVDLDPYGVLLLDPLSPTWVFPFGVLPTSSSFVIPVTTPTPLSLVIQDLALDGMTRAGNTSNSIALTIQ